MAKTDMSSQAVTARLKRVAQLRRLGLSLKKAKIIDARPVAKRNQSNASADRQSK
ncbi:MAG TPA: hypothetical protein VNF70_06590 [Pyrinomonadaceae bacterium]|nr:hypothetical protein [Pyrinomonadaceae bacterium]